MKHLDLFSGIGGFSLAVDMVYGPENVTHEFVEWDLFCQAVLRKHWPLSKIHGDIKTYKGYSAGSVDLVTGGFPCQPFSLAGKREGTGDDRDLWPEMFRVIQEAKPRWVIGENVAGFIQMELERSVADLESAGYEVQSFVIPAAAIGAPHRRDRVWIIAYSESNGSGGRTGSISRTHELQTEKRPQGRNAEPINADRIRTSINPLSVNKRSKKGGRVAGNVFPEAEREESANKARRSGGDDGADTSRLGLQRSEQPRSKEGSKSDDQLSYGRNRNGSRSDSKREGLQERPEKNGTRLLRSFGDDRNSAWDENWIKAATRLCGIHDGVPRRVDRLKALGNAIVPQVAAEIIKAIQEIEGMTV